MDALVLAACGLIYGALMFTVGRIIERNAQNTITWPED
mgnify:CR=1 FL=1